jgi:hypothetical protein
MKNQRKQDAIRNLQQANTQLCNAIKENAAAMREAKELGLADGAFGPEQFADAPVENGTPTMPMMSYGGGTNLTHAEFMALVNALDNILAFIENTEGRTPVAANYLPALYAAKMPGS